MAQATAQNTLDLRILKTLARGPNHGFGITNHIQTVSEGLLRIEEGSLDPALHRLERQQHITGEWKISENGRRALLQAERNRQDETGATPESMALTQRGRGPSPGGRMSWFPWRCRDLDRDLRKEMQFHMDMRADEYRQQGMSPQDSAAEAHRRFGSTSVVHEDTRQMHLGAAASLLETVGREIGFAFGSLRRAPAFTATAVLALPLGLGGASAVFSVVDRVLFRGLPYPAGDRLVAVGVRVPIADHAVLLGADYSEWKDQHSSRRTHCHQRLVRLRPHREQSRPRDLRRRGIHIPAALRSRADGRPQFPARRRPAESTSGRYPVAQVVARPLSRRPVNCGPADSAQRR
jgi:hypothetical protein